VAHTTDRPVPVAHLQLVRDEAELREAVRRQTRALPKRCASRDRYAANLRRDLFAPSKARRGMFRQLVALAQDAFARGAPEADVEEFGEDYLAMIRRWYRTRRGERLPTLAEAHHAEELAQGARESAETHMAYERTPSAAREFLSAASRHSAADRELRQVAHAIATGDAR